ncbi:MAG: hypothetical protein HC830_14315 [Bacteroidetes bacterium]|nr:hypothetical protein [Bacteroidota bacterium]
MGINAIRKDNNGCFYYRSSSGNFQIDFKGFVKSKVFEFLSGEDLGNNFTVDYLGNILTDSKYYMTDQTSGVLENAGSQNVIPVQSYVNKLYYLYSKGDSLTCSQIDISSSDIKEKNLKKTFYLPDSESQFIGSYAYAI